MMREVYTSGAGAAVDKRTRALLMSVRAALIMIVKAIETYLDM